MRDQLPAGQSESTSEHRASLQAIQQPELMGFLEDPLHCVRTTDGAPQNPSPVDEVNLFC